MSAVDLDLFLAHADDHRPFLERGLPAAAAAHGRRGEQELPPRMDYPSGNHSSLPLQRWAIIAPEGERGDRLLGAVEPLRRARAEQQGAEVTVYRVPPGMDKRAAWEWRVDVHEATAVRVEDRPRYLLVLGDADVVSWELQQHLGSSAFVGRVAFASERGYEAYTDKVLRWERAPAAPAARALFYSALDGSKATTVGHAHLMQPWIALAKERQTSGVFPVDEIVPLQGAGAVATLLEQTARPAPSVLFSMSHGLGAPRFGWDTPEDQRARQGALCLAAGRTLGAEDLARGAFLPGGMWVIFACYGAGTPAVSAYHEWLLELQKIGAIRDQAEDVLRGLPAPGDRPFVAALPQAVLESPDGPLAVLGHVDLAWSYSFQQAGSASGSRSERFQGVLRSLADGHRAGAACFELLCYFAQADTDLALFHDEAMSAQKAHLWMLRNDVRGYVLLGDPAARLPIAKGAPEVRPAAKGRSGAALDAARMEKAVLEVLQGASSNGRIAARYGCDAKELERWVEAYKAAGRAALEGLR
jgi:hypothetical protein